MNEIDQSNPQKDELVMKDSLRAIYGLNNTAIATEMAHALPEGDEFKNQRKELLTKLFEITHDKIYGQFGNEFKIENMKHYFFDAKILAEIIFPFLTGEKSIENLNSYIDQKPFRDRFIEPHELGYGFYMSALDIANGDETLAAKLTEDIHHAVSSIEDVFMGLRREFLERRNIDKEKTLESILGSICYALIENYDGTKIRYFEPEGKNTLSSINAIDIVGKGIVTENKKSGNGVKYILDLMVQLNFDSRIVNYMIDKIKYIADDVAKKKNMEEHFKLWRETNYLNSTSDTKHIE